MTMTGSSGSCALSRSSSSMPFTWGIQISRMTKCGRCVATSSGTFVPSSVSRTRKPSSLNTPRRVARIFTSSSTTRIVPSIPSSLSSYLRPPFPASAPPPCFTSALPRPPRPGQRHHGLFTFPHGALLTPAYRQFDDEPAASRLVITDTDKRLVIGHDGRDDGQPQAGAFLLGREIRLEQPGLHLGGDAAAGVGDLQLRDA